MLHTDDNINIKIANHQRQAIKDFMQDNNLTIHKWCKKAHIPDSTFRSFMTGKSHNLSMTLITKLARAECISLDYLLNFKEGCNPNYSKPFCFPLYDAVVTQCIKLYEKTDLALSYDVIRKITTTAYEFMQSQGYSNPPPKIPIEVAQAAFALHTQKRTPATPVVKISTTIS